MPNMRLLVLPTLRTKRVAPLITQDCLKLFRELENALNAERTRLLDDTESGAKTEPGPLSLRVTEVRRNGSITRSVELVRSDE